MTKVIKSLKCINWRLFTALMVMGLCPTIYTTVRTFFLGELPGDWAFSIAGQLSWVNLFYEIISEAIILPLFFFMGKSVEDKKEFSNKIKTGLIISATIYIGMSAIIMLWAEPLLEFMAASPDIISESAQYIRIESIASIFGVMLNFVTVALVTVGKEKTIYILTVVKLILSVALDTLLISSLPFSLNLGVNGIGYSNIIVNALLFVVVIVMLCKNGFLAFKGEKLSYEWCRGFFKIGGISGIESLVRNVAYMLMVSRMVNMVGEQGTYWVANNFIWGWMLLPVNQLGELIKQETAKDIKAVKDNTLGYFAATTIICLVWVVTIPLYKPFMANVLNFSDVDKLFELVMVLFVFYVAYAYQNIFDMTFYGRGATQYMLFESVVTNSVFYGGLFIAYLAGMWEPTLMGIALMFGLGNLFDTVVSAGAYCVWRKKGEESNQT